MDNLICDTQNGVAPTTTHSSSNFLNVPLNRNTNRDGEVSIRHLATSSSRKTNRKKPSEINTWGNEVDYKGKKPLKIHTEKKLIKINTWRDKPKKFVNRKTRINIDDHEVLIEKASRELKLCSDFYHKLREREIDLMKNKKKDRRRKTMKDLTGENIAFHCSLVTSRIDTVFNVGNFLLFVKNMKNIITASISKTMIFDLVFTISTYVMSLGLKTEDVTKTATRILALCVSIYQGYESQAAYIWEAIKADVLEVTTPTAFIYFAHMPMMAFEEAKQHFGYSDPVAVHTNFEDYVKNLSNTVFVKEMIPQFVLSIPLIALSIPFPAAFTFLKSSKAVDFYLSVTKNFDSYRKAIFDFVDNILPHLLDGEFVPSTDARQTWVEETALMLDSLSSPLAMHKFVADKGVKVGDSDRAVRTAMLPILHRQAIVGNTLMLKKETVLTTTISRYLILLKLAEANTQQMLTTTNYVEQPVVILWYGSAGCGKSELVEKMSRHLTKLLGLVQVPSTTDCDRMMNSMYTVVSTAKYMDGYFGQDIVLFDDLGATKSDTGPILDIFLKGVGTIPYFPNQAELDFKGKIQWAAKLVHVTSNDKTCYLGSNVFHMPAWNRRMSIQVGITVVEGVQKFRITVPSRDGTTDEVKGEDLSKEEMAKIVYHLAAERQSMSQLYTKQILTEDFKCSHGKEGSDCSICYPSCGHLKKVLSCKICCPPTTEIVGQNFPVVYDEEEKSEEAVPWAPLLDVRIQDTLDYGEFELSFLPSRFWITEDTLFYLINHAAKRLIPYNKFRLGLLAFSRFVLEMIYQGDFNLYFVPYLFLFQKPLLATLVHIFLKFFGKYLPCFSVLKSLKIKLYGPIYRKLANECNNFTLRERLYIMKMIFTKKWDDLNDLICEQKQSEKINRVNLALSTILKQFHGRLSPYRWYLGAFGSTIPFYFLYKKFVYSTEVVYTQLGMAIPSSVTQKAIELDYRLGVTPMLNSTANSQTTTYPSYPIQTASRLRTIDSSGLLETIRRQTLTLFVSNGKLRGDVQALISGNIIFTVKHAFEFDEKELEVTIHSDYVKQWCVTKTIHKSQLFDVGKDIVAFIVAVQLGKNLVSHFHMSELNTGDFVTLSSEIKPTPVFKKYIDEKGTPYHGGQAWAHRGDVQPGDSGTPICYVRYEGGVIKNLLIVGLASGYFGKDEEKSTFFGVFERLPEVIGSSIVQRGIEEYDLGTSKKIDLIEPNPHYAMAGHLPPEVQPICVGSFQEKGAQRSSVIAQTDWITKFPAIEKKYCVPAMKSRVVGGNYICNHLSAMKQMAEVALIKDPTGWIIAADYVADHLSSLSPPMFETMSIQQAVSGFSSIPSINMSTSIGFPFVGPKGDHFFGTHGSLMPSDEILSEIAYWEEHLSRGSNMIPLVRGSVKDEVTTYKKRDAGEERIFFSGSTVFVILLRMYYGSFMEWLGTTRFRSFTSIGINALSPEWKKLADYLKADGDRLFLDTDYSKFDKRMNILNFAVDVATKFIIEHSNYSDRAQKIMRTLSASIYQFCVDMRGDVYHYSTSTPSGVFGTSHFNCLCEAMIEIAVFSACYGSYNKLDFQQSLTLVRSGDMFFKNIRLCNYGDDNVKSAPVEMINTFFTAEKIQMFSRALGYDVTSIEKDGTPLKWKLLSECTFLKRSFHFVDDHVFSPLEKMSIEKMICFRDTKSPLTLKDWEKAVKGNMLLESVQHGEEYYEYIRSILGEGDPYPEAYLEFLKIFSVGVVFTQHLVPDNRHLIFLQTSVRDLRMIGLQDQLVPAREVEEIGSEEDDDSDGESDNGDDVVTRDDVVVGFAMQEFTDRFRMSVFMDDRSSIDWMLNDPLFRYYRRRLREILLQLCDRGFVFQYKHLWDAMDALALEFNRQHHPSYWVTFWPITLYDDMVLAEARKFTEIDINPFPNFRPHDRIAPFTEMDLVNNASASLIPAHMEGLIDRPRVPFEWNPNDSLSQRISGNQAVGPPSLLFSSSASS